MRELLHLDLLRSGKSLLAFSGGVDSTALFHLLLYHKIDFDIAHVNYHTRPSSDSEATSAKVLAEHYSLQCHLHECVLEPSNFEHEARRERYRFFETLIKEYGYRYLITAHQLNDRLEWLLMQLCRGSGLAELSGMHSHDARSNMQILRPLLEWDRDSIETYLSENSLKYFIDESNNDETYLRNRFRHRYAQPLMEEFASGIRQSFRYLQSDKEHLIESVHFHSVHGLHWAHRPDDSRSAIFGIDKQLKTLGHLMSGNEKDALLSNDFLVVGRKWAVWIASHHLFIAPYVIAESMDKRFKETCRKLKIEPKFRGFLSQNSELFEYVVNLLEVD